MRKASNDKVSFHSAKKVHILSTNINGDFDMLHPAVSCRGMVRDESTRQFGRYTGVAPGRQRSDPGPRCRV